ncbi:MAG: hypothetical protein QOK29_2633 [Rhodospirillaceae bacterium]|jgi:hypothetical protein|nr:hypothetical protein [Rhodospirillaceae bacterium]
MKIGSQDHKERFCRQFVASHELYQPDKLPWPDLDDAALERLRSVPFWQEVLHTERRAGAIVNAFATTIEDPLIRDAVALQGLEEARHARLLEVMIERYGIDVTEPPLGKLPEDTETAFIDFGYGECLDSFLGFGVFKIARQSGFLPESMFKIFDVLMYEETRHIVFFVNWMAHREARHGRGAGWLRGMTSLRFYVRAFRRMAGTVRKGAGANDGKDFAATQAGVFLEGFNFRRFLEDCYAENARRMSSFDEDLLRPRFLPALADAALSGLRLWTLGRAPERRAS